TWTETDAKTNVVKQTGTIGTRPGDMGLSFRDASIAVNAAGDVVIGLTGTSATQSLSAYYVVGHTKNGITSFGDVQLTAGTSCAAPTSMSSSYSSTTIDPTDPYNFWTFEQYVPICFPFGYTTAWGLNIHQASLAPADRPIATADTYLVKQDTSLAVGADQGV